MHDYWIGDRVWITSLQQEGIFEGEQADQAIVKVNNEKKLFPLSDLTLLPEEEDDFDLEALGVHTKPIPKNPFDFPDTIDLHIEELNPKLIDAEPALILAHQRSRLKDFLSAAIHHHKSQVTIIHGKGEGVLRSDVLTVLKEFSEIRTIEEEGHGGAMIVKFK
ncbi:MAG TPA: Smr/MutS family protein [Saprospiraceae bacterium]|nr:Smr/MutS family protein [Saprospiraceae bacterium]